MPTIINYSIMEPSSDVTLDIGTSILRFRNLYTLNVLSSSETISAVGTVKGTTDLIALINRGNAVDMDGTNTAIRFDQWYYDAVTPAVIAAARILSGTETDWTSTASTQNAYLSLQTALSGVISERLRVTSSGLVGINTAAPGAMLEIYPTATGVIGQQINALAGQTGNLLEFRNSSDAVMMQVTAAGALSMMEAGGGTDLATISVAALGAARAYTIPDAGGAANFILSTTGSPSRGDVLRFDGTTWVSLGPGPSGRFLMTQGAGADPMWSPVTAAGVQGYTAHTFTNQTSVIVVHNFGTYPVVQILDGTGVQIIPLNVTHGTVNQFTVSFSTSTSGTVLATVGSPYIVNVKTETSDYLLTTADTVILGNAAITLTLPTCVGNAGKTYTVKNIHPSATVTVAPHGAETIDGVGGNMLVVHNTSISLVTDGGGWYIT